jgi:uncharacterized protein YidB (DUF937 family)
MGLLDSALSALTNSAGGAGGMQGQVTQVLGTLLQQHGGLGGLVTQLSQGGLANEVASWIGTGQNAPVRGAQIANALGQGSIAQIAQQLGVDPAQAGAMVAQVLPHLIDHLSPNGQLPGNAPTDLGGLVTAIAGRLMR